MRPSTAASAGAFAPLGERLPGLAPGAVPLVRALFDRRYVWPVPPGEHRWQLLAKPPAAGRWIQLAGERHCLSLLVTRDAGAADTGARAWWDYDGDDRLLAWGLAHEPLLEQLGALFDESWQPQALLEHAPTQKDGLVLGWRSLRGDIVAEGGIALSPEAARVLADKKRADTTPPPAGSAPWQDLAVRLRLTLDAPPFSAEELRAFAPGDVMLLDTAARCLAAVSLSIAGHRAASAQYQDGCLRITRLFPTQEIPVQEDIAMPQADDDTPKDAAPGGAAPPDPAAAGAEATSLPVDDLPIALHFDIGEQRMTLGELAALQPGYSFALDNPVEGARVRIRAHDRVIGEGELIAIGDDLGVRLVTLAGDAGR